jgi:polysaccharide deacetylase 2 family uncharacterized protein YibQ
MRGFFGGLILGLVVAAAGAAALSLSRPLPERPEVGAEPTRAAGTVPAAGGASGLGSGAGRDGDLVEAAPAAPGATSAGRDNLASLEGANTEPADKPQVGGASAGLDGSSVAPERAGVSVDAENPVSTVATPGDAPAAPMGDSDVSVSTGQPQQPVLPDVSDTGSGFGASGATPEAAPDMPSRASDPQPTAGDGEAVTRPVGDMAPDPSTETAAAPAPAEAPVVASASGDGTGAPMVSDIDSAPAQPGAGRPGAAMDPGVAPAADTSVSEAPADDPSRIAALPQAGTDAGASGPQVGEKVVPLTERDDPASDPADTVAVAAPSGPPPVEIYAEPFENPEGKPVMAIVLIDDSTSIGVEALQEFPYALTFAVDPSAPDAAEKMARHRAAGFEVVALADLPATATPQDAEVSLAVWMNDLPEIVALLEGTGSGVQGNRQLSDQVTAIAGGRGLGLILQDKGLNTAQKLAARAGVPSAVVFRDFDGAGQMPAVMRRFLDQAAFRARQEGAVIMLGRVRPDTISALLLWGLQDRAGSVALAPVSAVLTRQPE